MKNFYCQKSIKKKGEKYRVGEVTVCSATTFVSRMQISSYVIGK